jgi:hypothetical protein
LSVNFVPKPAPTESFPLDEMVRIWVIASRLPSRLRSFER